MHKRFFSKISGYAVALSFVLTWGIVQPVFAETKTKENPDGSKTITASSGYEWTVGKDGKTKKTVYWVGFEAED